MNDQAKALLVFGQLLTEHRKRVGLNQKDLDISMSYTSEVEKGKKICSANALKKYIEKLGLTDTEKKHFVTAWRNTRPPEEAYGLGQIESAAVSNGLEVDLSDDEWPATAESPFPVIGSGYRIMNMTNRYYLDELGKMTEQVTNMSIKALRSHVELVALSNIYYADRRRGVLSIEPESGYKVVRETETDEGAMRWVLRLDRPLQPEGVDSFDLEYRIKVSTELPSAPRVNYSQLNYAERIATYLQFTAPALPDCVRWIRTKGNLAVEFWEINGTPLPHDPGGLYWKGFENVRDEVLSLCWKGAAW